MVKYFKTSKADLVAAYNASIDRKEVLFEKCQAIAKLVGAVDPVFLGNPYTGYQCRGFRFDKTPDLDLWLQNKRVNFCYLRKTPKTKEKAALLKELRQKVEPALACAYKDPEILNEIIGIDNIYQVGVCVRRSADHKTLYLEYKGAVPKVEGWVEIMGSEFESLGE